MFDCSSMAGDPYETIFKEDEVEVSWCKKWEYVEVIGLSNADFIKVFKTCGFLFSYPNDFKF